MGTTYLFSLQDPQVSGGTGAIDVERLPLSVVFIVYAPASKQTDRDVPHIDELRVMSAQLLR
jgi:hypothetical protein